MILINLNADRKSFRNENQGIQNGKRFYLQLQSVYHLLKPGDLQMYVERSRNSLIKRNGMFV